MPVAHLAVMVSTEVLTDQKDSNDLRQKLHRSLLAVVEKLQRKETLSSADEGGFIRNGKAEVQVWLTDKSPAVFGETKRARLRS